MRLITAAARWPARNDPANSQFERPSAIGRMRFSTQLLPGMLEARATSWRGHAAAV
jgi:hypothetical protein